MRFIYKIKLTTRMKDMLIGGVVASILIVLAYTLINSLNANAVVEFTSVSDYDTCMADADKRRLESMKSTEDIKEYGYIYDKYFFESKECKAKLDEFNKRK